MNKLGIEKDGNKSVLRVIASRGLGVAELAAIGIVYPYTKTIVK